MKKLIIIFFLFISLVTQGAIYYVKDDGSDANTGLSDAQAWQTLTKVNAVSFAPGDMVLFKRGDTFRGYLAIPTSGTAGNYITYGAYGSGAKPKILGAYDASLATDWDATLTPNVFVTANSVESYWLDAGNIIFNNEASWGVREELLASLNAQGEWFINRTTGLVYLYSVGNPGTFYTHIEIGGYYSTEVIYAYAKDYIIIQDLDVRYSGNNGILPREGSDHWIIERCNVSFIGGNDYDGSVRMGNGIGVWRDATDITIRYNVVSQCFDAGISPQGNAPYTQSNIQIYYNIISLCYYNYEIWAVTTEVVSNINFYNNICLDPGNQWSLSPVNQRWDTGTNARHVMAWQFTSAVPASEINIKNNIFQGNDDEAIRIGAGEHLVDFDYNDYYGVTVMALTDAGVYTTLAQWQAGESQDVNSIDDNPSWISATDYRLNPGSPCINTGLAVGLTVDIAGTTIVGLPDIGAYEYASIAPGLATLTTTAITFITENSANSGGNISSDGGATVTQRGVCWSTSADPTVVDSHTSDGSGTGAFSSAITGLIDGTLYHVRAYATNSAGTAYGEDRSFTAEDKGEVEIGGLIQHTGILVIFNGHLIYVE